jgi:hypothetical protein
VTKLQARLGDRARNARSPAATAASPASSRRSAAFGTSRTVGSLPWERGPPSERRSEPTTDRARRLCSARCRSRSVTSEKTTSAATTAAAARRRPGRTSRAVGRWPCWRGPDGFGGAARPRTAARPRHSAAAVPGRAMRAMLSRSPRSCRRRRSGVTWRARPTPSGLTTCRSPAVPRRSSARATAVLGREGSCSQMMRVTSVRAPSGSSYGRCPLSNSYRSTPSEYVAGSRDGAAHPLGAGVLRCERARPGWPMASDRSGLAAWRCRSRAGAAYRLASRECWRA